jgi:hypothetical protein
LFKGRQSSIFKKKEVTEMESRLNYTKLAPGGVQAIYKLHKYVEESGSNTRFWNLSKRGRRKINGCAYCIDMHTKDARARRSEQRLYLLNAWREAPFYTERERAALAWTEAITLISESQASDEDYAAARAYFSEQELVNLDDGNHLDKRLEPARDFFPAVREITSLNGNTQVINLKV